MVYTVYSEKEKLWSGLKVPPLYNPNISLGLVIWQSLKAAPHKIAQISADSGIRMTFGEILSKTIRAARNIQRLGLDRRAVIGIMAKNSHNLAPIVFGSICAGYPINTLDPAFSKSELMHMLSTTKPKVMFCDVDTFDLVAESLSELRNDAQVFTFNGQVEGSTFVEVLFADTGAEDDFVPAEVDGQNDIAAIVCSSGTTGLSKGVCLSHAALLDRLARAPLMSEEDVIFSFSSLYWLSGFTLLLYGTLGLGTRVITTQSFSPELLLELIETYRLSFIFCASHQTILTLKHEKIHHTDLSSVKCFTTGGSKIGSSTCIEMSSFLPNGSVQIIYGMSEIAGLITLNKSIEKDAVGKLADSIQIKITDINGERCGINENGEICIKTTYAFLGYYGDAKTSHELIDDEGFIKTGDIGHFDDDGDLFLVDRKKDLLKYRSIQVSPGEIEGYLIDCKDIKSVCVVGIPDDVAGDLPAAVIVRNGSSTISEQQICDMVLNHFSDAKRLRGGVYFVDSLPTTPSGKISRRKAKDLVMDVYNQNISKFLE